MTSLFKNTSVIELTPKNFVLSPKIGIVHPSLKGDTKALVIFAAAFCGWCKKVKPVYVSTANTLGKSFPMFSLDCEKYSELVAKLKINSFPTIKFVNKNGTLGKMFEGNRTVEGFLGEICRESSICK